MKNGEVQNTQRHPETISCVISHFLAAGIASQLVPELWPRNALNFFIVEHLPRFGYKGNTRVYQGRKKKLIASIIFPDYHKSFFLDFRQGRDIASSV
ncbi:hypothetical protein CHS0354_023285 [Potamilus streckersoni]|uniref:Uncharacterized protein n=1 Tax=Potamilus streckersoni TaxID=2493646 RepID=A0AAE0T4J7_9BIVA|nr:hypothetical protein CHS0354_023285 [Potamilus streckersoni]